MAVTAIKGPDSAKVTLSTSYLSATDYVTVEDCDWIEVWIDEAGAVAGDVRVAYTNGDNNAACDTPLAAGGHYTIEPGRFATLYIDAKADSGTPSLCVITGQSGHGY